MIRMNNLVDDIEKTLIETFSPVSCRVNDDSHLHAGHQGNTSGGGHYTVHIVAEAFEGKSRLQRHRLVYASLAHFIPSRIHALAINAHSPSDNAL